MLAARLIKIPQRLLQTMRPCFGKPGMLDFGFHQFVGLLAVVHPRAPAPIVTTLPQTGVPHRPTHISGQLRHPHLIVGQLDPEPSTGLHNPQPNTGHRYGVATPRPTPRRATKAQLDALTPDLKTGSARYGLSITRRLGAIAAPRHGLGAMPDGGECRIAAMSDEIDVSLFCPAQHHVGNLVKFSTQIAYHPIGGKLAAWPPHQADMWWEVSCPEGCPGAFGGAVDPIRQEVDRLAADPNRTNAHYTLKRVG
jgi:hypothetical protein